MFFVIVRPYFARVGTAVMIGSQIMQRTDEAFLRYDDILGFNTYIVFIDFCNRKYLANVMIRSSIILILLKLKPYIFNMC